MIACGFEDVREHKPAVSGKILCILCIDVNRLTMNRFPAIRRRRLFQVSPAPAPHDGADHSEEKQPFVNEDEPPMNTNSHEDPPSTTTGAKMLLHFCPVGVTLSWEEAHPGARASRPHKSSRSFSHLLHRNQPAAAPCLGFGRAHAVPADRAGGCNIAGKLSGNRRDSMRAGRPRSRGVSSQW